MKMEFKERDLIASLAMMGMLSNGVTCSDEEIAITCYSLADEMIKEGEREEPQEGIAAISKRRKAR